MERNPDDPQFDGGRGAGNDCRQAATAALADGLHPAAVLALGDEQYPCGGDVSFAQSYGPAWGRFLSITHPVPGNQEYATTGGTDCDPTGRAGGYFRYFGRRA